MENSDVRESITDMRMFNNITVSFKEVGESLPRQSGMKTIFPKIIHFHKLSDCFGMRSENTRSSRLEKHLA